MKPLNLLFIHKIPDMGFLKMLGMLALEVRLRIKHFVEGIRKWVTFPRGFGPKNEDVFDTF